MIDIIDSKVIVDSYPSYMVLEIFKEDLPLLTKQPNLPDRYTSELTNVLFYTEQASEAKQFIENR